MNGSMEPGGPSAPPPARLGRYRLCSELASGGMATVYLARLEDQAGHGFEKFVAVKVVHRHLAHERQFIDMFLDEARLSASIDHPNVCSVFDFGQADGVYYLAMEYLLGEPLLRISNKLASLRDTQRLAALPWYAARIFADACEGLHAAHELRDAEGTPLGVVHRDVTPQNVIVTYDGSVKVLDFGVAKAGSQLHTTEAGKIKGKLAYVSPEQLRNRALDRRSDVFSAGVCLWEFLVLKRLFRRDSEAATLMAVASDEIPAPSSIRKWVPAELDAIVLKALARDPDERYPSARAMGRDLAAFLTRSGATLGMSDVSEWMRALFEEERATRLKELRRAREAVGLAPTIRDGSEVSSTGSVVPSVSLEVSGAPPVPHPPSPATHAGSRPAARTLALVGALGALGSAAVGGAVHLATRPSMVASALPAEAPTPPPSAPGPFDADPPRQGAGPGAAEREPQDPTAPPQAPSTAGTADTAVADVPDTDVPAEPTTGPDVPSAPAGAPREPRPPRRVPSRAATPEAADTAAADAPAARTGASTATGRVMVVGTAEAWATVEIDGRPSGRTPVSAELPVGHHVLRFLPLGQEPAHHEAVDLQRGDVVVLRVRLGS